MTTQTALCNSALQILGAAPIADITDDTQSARECSRAFTFELEAELRAHPWRCAVARQVLAPLSETPAFDYDYQFQIPSDCLRILPPNDPYLDWQVEGNRILTNQSTTLYLRYIKRITDYNALDPLLARAFAARLAVQLAEVLTQSNSKKDAAVQQYTAAIREARRVNAFEKLSAERPEDTWVLARL